MTNNTPVRDAAQLAAEEVFDWLVSNDRNVTGAEIEAFNKIIRKHFPSPPLPVSGEIPTPRTDAEMYPIDEFFGRDGLADKKVVRVKFARQLERELAIANKKNSNSLANNLCPDHRDKQNGKPCLACVIERKEKELATERAAREQEIPTITNRTKNMARERLGEVLKHSDGPNSASHGCVEVTKAVAEIEYWIARAEATESTLAELYELSRPSLHSNPLSAIKLAIENGKNFATELTAREAALNSFHAANKERLALKDRAEAKEALDLRMVLEKNYGKRQ